MGKKTNRTWVLSPIKYRVTYRKKQAQYKAVDQEAMHVNHDLLKQVPKVRLHSPFASPAHAVGAALAWESTQRAFSTESGSSAPKQTV